MAKVEEEQPGIIPLNERKPELEKEVQYYLTIAEKPSFVSKKRYTTNKIPERFKDKREELDFWLEEMKRISFGYDGLSGKGYGFLNYAKLRDPQKGRISPEFRVKQEEYFRKVEYHQQNPGRGLVGFKRRRWGFTSIGAWDDYHDAITKPFYQIGMNSKSENDSRLLFRHIKFIHQNMPEQLRPVATASDRRDFMEFAWYEKDQQGNRIKHGLQSWISCVAPTDNAHEGQAYSKLRIDEAGKIENLLSLWSFAEDCLRLNTQRVSPAIILGTVGDIDRDGKGLRELYLNNEAYQLDRFAVYGYHGLIIDEFGNDLIEDAIRFVVYERERLKAATRKMLMAFLQKYPLCERDAFNQVVDGGVGNIHLINDQIIKLSATPPEIRTGWMRPKPEGGVDFVPNPDGKIIVYELPDHKRVNGYVAGSDPADHDDKKKKAGKDVSDLALAIVAKPFGAESPKLVLEYVDRPEKLDVFFEQSAMALQWYNGTKVLTEDNRARMINYFKIHYPHLLPLVPASILTAKSGFEMKNSVTMTEHRKQQMMGLIEDNVDHYSAYIPSIKLLEQFKVFGDLHADDDLAIAYGWALVMLQADKKAVQLSDQISKNAQTYKLERVNGLLRPSVSLSNPRNIPRTVWG